MIDFDEVAFRLAKAEADNKVLQHELIRTKKQLETYHNFITKLYLNGDITDERLQRLQQELEQKDKR